MNELIKKLTSKNPKDYKQVAYDLVNNSDVKLFSELVSLDNVLYDYIKDNVAFRLKAVCNKSNYKNLLKFFTSYSPFYADFIISVLVEYSTPDLVSDILTIFRNGTDDEKAYCAKFFANKKIDEAIELLLLNKDSQFEYLQTNCAQALGVFKEKSSYDEAILKLKAQDDFIVFEGVKFLVAYGDKSCINNIIELIKSSSVNENIAGELLYLVDLFTLYEQNQEDALYIYNLIINSLGEIFDLNQVLDYRLYDFIQMLIEEPKNSKIATVLVNTFDKFITLTENDEYMYDLLPFVKDEINFIKDKLNNMNLSELYILLDKELNENSLFVFSAIEYSDNENLIRKLLSSTNQTIVFRALESLKTMSVMTQSDKKIAIDGVKDESIRSIIEVM